MRKADGKRVRLRVAHRQQDAEADDLRERRRQRRARRAHIQHEDEDGVEHDVENTARGDADHAVHRQPLKAQQVVHHERAHHKRHGVEDVGGIILGVGGDGLRRAEEANDGVDVRQAEKRQNDARDERREERRGGVGVGLFAVARAERLADVRARAHADHKGDGLNDRHGGEDDAHRAGGGGAELADEEGIGHVVNVGDEHGDDRRHGELRDDAAHRVAEEHVVALFGCHGFHGLILLGFSDSLADGRVEIRADTPPARARGSAPARPERR